MGGVAALLKKDWRIARNLRRVLREQSTFKVVFILFFALFMVSALWGLFLEGFHFLSTLGGVGLMLVSRLFALFFLGLGIMLSLSSVVTSYTSFFSSTETTYLLLKPLDAGQISVYKFFQSAFYASWAFFFTIIPFVGAYAWHERLPAFFSVWTILFSIPLVLLCSGVGTVVCLLVARWFPRGRALWTTIGAAMVLGLWWASRVLAGQVTNQEEATLLLNRLIPGLRIASHPLWPSWWISEGIMSLTRGQWGRGFLYWALLVANVLMLIVVIEALGRRLFYDAFQRTQFAERKAARRDALFRPFERSLRFLGADLRALILKDMRTFVRDAAQWSQVLIFFGLLALYFLNLRSFRYHQMPPEWRNLVAFLNVFSVSAVMCSFGSRFVYPQLSLEGHGFWIVGLSPTTMGRVLLAKFLLAWVGMLVASVSLMYLSSHMLIVPLSVKLVAIGVAVAMAFAISGLSTGLGALFLDLKQQNPAAIVSGFGGTLNLALSLGFMFAAIVPFGVMFHLRYVGHLTYQGLWRGVAVGAVWLVFLTALTALLPLYLGARSLRRREY